MPQTPMNEKDIIAARLDEIDQAHAVVDRTDQVFGMLVKAINEGKVDIKDEDPATVHVNGVLVNVISLRSYVVEIVDCEFGQIKVDHLAQHLDDIGLFLRSITPYGDGVFIRFARKDA